MHWNVSCLQFRTLSVHLRKRVISVSEGRFIFIYWLKRSNSPAVVGNRQIYKPEADISMFLYIDTYLYLSIYMYIYFLIQPTDKALDHRTDQDLKTVCVLKEQVSSFQKSWRTESTEQALPNAAQLVPASCATAAISCRVKYFHQFIWKFTEMQTMISKHWHPTQSTDIHPAC